MNNDVTRENCQGDQGYNKTGVTGNDNHFHSLYQRVGSRTGFIHRLMNSQFLAPEAEAIAFKIWGHPTHGGGQSNEA